MSSSPASSPLVDIQVELPTYSHRFGVAVDPGASIVDVKHAIHLACIGQPRPAGQRLISRGRCVSDEERIADIWKAPEEIKVLHLAVHPSAWTSAPPSVPPTPVRSSMPTLTRTVPTTPLLSSFPRTGSSRVPSLRTISSPSIPPSPAASSNHTQSYIKKLHDAALKALQGGGVPTPLNDVSLRQVTMQAVERSGFSWPAVFDEPYPIPSSSKEPEQTGICYEKTVISGKEYLKLIPHSGTPTPIQLHALRVLTYTFPLLPLELPPLSTVETLPSTQVHQLPVVRDVNSLLQQLGLGHLRVAPDQPVRVEPQGVTFNLHQNNGNPPLNVVNANADGNVNLNNANVPPGAAAALNAHQNPMNMNAALVRTLLASMTMLVVRTLLLVYFVSPARKPVFGIVIGIWIMYEAFRAIRALLGVDFVVELQFMGADGQRHGGNGANGNAAQGQRQQQAQPQGPQGPRAQGPQNRQSQNMDALLDTLGSINLRNEEEALSSRNTNSPSLLHKARTFAILLLLTLHPAVWNRRRGVLRRREGRLTTEARAMQASSEAEQGNRVQQLRAVAERRPRWVRQYVDRAVRGEWVDDM